MPTSLTSQLTDRLVRYCAMATPSDESAAATPSTPGQLALGRLLHDELVALGAAGVVHAENGFVYTTIPTTMTAHAVPTGTVPTVAFLAHLDTVFVTEPTVKPRVHPAYDGSAITFPDDELLVLLPEINPYLATKLGDTIITASGRSVLGADDKAGVAILMTLAEQLLAHPEIPHGEIRLCFTPDEETGTGIRHIDLRLLNAQFAYTLDGGDVGDLNFETFSADKATVHIVGVPTHAGAAKGKMVNALHLAAKITDLLPHATRTPDTTGGREGFLHLHRVEGTFAEVTMTFLLRDFERAGLAAHGDLLRTAAAAVALTEPRARIEVSVTPQYRNMRYWLEQDMRPVHRVEAAMHALGIAPLSHPIRGGTDGSQLTEMGVPTPNIFTGMQNIHSQLEWISAEDMEKAVQVCIKTVELWATA